MDRLIVLQFFEITEVSASSEIFPHTDMAVEQFHFNKVESDVAVSLLKQKRIEAVLNFLKAVRKGLPNLKQLCLRKCLCLVSFAQVAGSLESLQLEECRRIAQLELFGSLLNCGTLKVVSLVNCLGFRNLNIGSPAFSPCKSVRSLSICNCPGFGDDSLAILVKLCPQKFAY